MSRYVCGGAWRPILGSDAERYLVLFAIVAYVIWVFAFGVYRYLIPLEMLSFVLIGVCVRRLLVPAQAWPSVAVVLAAIVALSLVTEWSAPRRAHGMGEPLLQRHGAAGACIPGGVLDGRQQPQRLHRALFPYERLLRRDLRQHPAHANGGGPYQTGPARV